jgi:hypothetical protein
MFATLGLVGVGLSVLFVGALHVVAIDVSPVQPPPGHRAPHRRGPGPGHRRGVSRAVQRSVFDGDRWVTGCSIVR